MPYNIFMCSITDYLDECGIERGQSFELLRLAVKLYDPSETLRSTYAKVSEETGMSAATIEKYIAVAVAAADCTPKEFIAKAKDRMTYENN